MGLSMTKWTIKLVNGSEFKFDDLQKVIGHYYALHTDWIHKLQSRIKEQPTYSVHVNLIDTIRGPKSETLLAPFLLLLITTTKLSVTFLGELTEDETGYIIGLWPTKFLHIIKSDKDAIHNLLYVITNQPELVEKVDVYF
jgi:hypothetical protein